MFVCGETYLFSRHHPQAKRGCWWGDLGYVHANSSSYGHQSCVLLILGTKHVFSQKDYNSVSLKKR